jgi:hypothetical protein
VTGSPEEGFVVDGGLACADPFFVYAPLGPATKVTGWQLETCPGDDGASNFWVNATLSFG